MLETLRILTGAMVPCAVLDIDIAEDVGDIDIRRADGRPYRSAWILVRRASRPIGTVIIKADNNVLPGAELVATLCAELSIARDDTIPELGDDAPTSADITVVVCTRERPEALKRCLGSLAEQEYGSFRLLVIDNAPRTGRTKAVVDELNARMSIDYMVEPIPGLARARNRALVEITSPLIAWIDDDEVADRWWIRRLVGSFKDSRVASVCGMMIPAELETDAQAWFEQWGGHSKGRGCSPAEFAVSDIGRSGALYPLPPFGTGGNMAVRREAMLKIGGFDEALGAGTPAMGGEDTLALTELMLSGTKIVYNPRAITRHYHRVDEESLHKQLYGYGLGLTAFYTALVMNHPTVLPGLLGLVPRALRDLHSPTSVRNSGIREAFPPMLLRANRRGMLLGPKAYLERRLQLKHSYRPHRIRVVSR